MLQPTRSVRPPIRFHGHPLTPYSVRLANDATADGTAGADTSSMSDGWLGLVGVAVGAASTFSATVFAQLRAERQRQADREAAKKDELDAYWTNERRRVYTLLMQTAHRWYEVIESNLGVAAGRYRADHKEDFLLARSFGDLTTEVRILAKPILRDLILNLHQALHDASLFARAETISENDYALQLKKLTDMMVMTVEPLRLELGITNLKDITDWMELEDNLNAQSAVNAARISSE